MLSRGVQQAFRYGGHRRRGGVFANARSRLPIALQELPEAVDRRAAEHDLEHDAGDSDGERDDHDDEVLEQHAKQQQHDTERWQGVESRERRREEGAGGSGDDEQAKDDVAQAMVKQETQAGSGEALEPAPSSSESSPPRQRRGHGEDGGTGVEEQGSRGLRVCSAQPHRYRREAGGGAGGDQADPPGCIAAEDRA
jgi:hypothetical protein